jgi:ribonuclease HI
MSAVPLSFHKRAYFAVCVGELPGVYDTRAAAIEAAGKLRHALTPLILHTTSAREAALMVQNFHDASVVYTDGSALEVDGHRVAGAGVFWGKLDPRNLAACVHGPPTSSVAEFEAIEHALDAEIEAVENADAPRRRPLIIVTDSLEAHEALTRCYHMWKSNGWRRASGKPVKNQRLIQRIVDKMARVPHAHLHHVHHRIHAGNIAADKLAVEAARSKCARVD